MTFKLQYPLSHPLNKVNVKKFIQASAPDARDAVRKFIKATTHISFETFISYINRNLADIIANAPKDRPIFAFVDVSYLTYQKKSNFWIFLYIKQLAKAKYNRLIYFAKSLDSRQIKDNDIVLIVDDCIYSGNQTAVTIYAIDNAKMKHLNIVLFVPFISHAGLNKIKQSFKASQDMKNCVLHLPKYIYYINDLKTYMTEDEFATIQKYYRYYNGNTEKLYEDVRYQITKYPVYFDHKVGDMMSSFPLIYDGVVPNHHNLQIEKQILELKSVSYDEFRAGMKRLYLQTEMYPLIKHCENYQSLEEGDCPTPPYKQKDYEEFLKFVKAGLPSRRTTSLRSRTYTRSSQLRSVQSVRSNRSLSSSFSKSRGLSLTTSVNKRDFIP